MLGKILNHNPEELLPIISNNADLDGLMVLLNKRQLGKVYIFKLEEYPWNSHMSKEYLKVPPILCLSQRGVLNFKRNIVTIYNTRARTIIYFIIFILHLSSATYAIQGILQRIKPHKTLVRKY